MTRSPARLLPLALALLCGAPLPARAQLRPLEPAPWEVLEGERSWSASVGVGALLRQRAALAGTEGRLLEAGNFRAAWRTGRVALEVGGTAQRFFEDRRTLEPPLGAGSGPRRHDTGDVRVATVLRLTPERAPAAAALRFGTRLPTTDDEVGLDRDRTDFFALVGGRVRRGRVGAAAEVGLGIHGSHDPEYEQADVLLFGGALEVRAGPLRPTAVLLGQRNGRWQLRGNENLAELRLGARVGGRRWVEALWVRGLAPFSPGAGVLLAAGTGG